MYEGHAIASRLLAVMGEPSTVGPGLGRWVSNIQRMLLAISKGRYTRSNLKFALAHISEECYGAWSKNRVKLKLKSACNTTLDSAPIGVVQHLNLRCNLHYLRPIPLSFKNVSIVQRRPGLERRTSCQLPRCQPLDTPLPRIAA
jgi:hypothetical protein